MTGRRGPARGAGVLGAPVACDHCAATIMWLRTEHGKLMPVDARADWERGNVRRDGGRATVLGRAEAAAQRAAGVPLRTHHRLSCPHASKWASGTRAAAAAKPAPAEQPPEPAGGLW